MGVHLRYPDFSLISCLVASDANYKTWSNSYHRSDVQTTKHNKTQENNEELLHLDSVIANHYVDEKLWTRAASKVSCMKLMPASLEKSIQAMRERRVVTRTLVSVRSRVGWGGVGHRSLQTKTKLGMQLAQVPVRVLVRIGVPLRGRILLLAILLATVFGAVVVAALVISDDCGELVAV